MKKVKSTIAYYYIKLKDNFFESDQILILEAMENGYIYSNILIKLYLKSVKFNGALKVNDNMFYNIDTVSTILKMDKNIVEKAFKAFEELNLITIKDNEINMNNIEEISGRKTFEAIKKEDYRKRINKKNEEEINKMIIDEDNLVYVIHKFEKENKVLFLKNEKNAIIKYLLHIKDKFNIELSNENISERIKYFAEINEKIDEEDFIKMIDFVIKNKNWKQIKLQYLINSGLIK